MLAKRTPGKQAVGGLGHAIAFGMARGHKRAFQHRSDRSSVQRVTNGIGAGLAIVKHMAGYYNRDGTDPPSIPEHVKGPP